MHYKRIQKHGTADYRWGGRIIGRACLHCERPVVAHELCNRHYQMLQRHGDALFADKKKRAHMRPGIHMRRGYIMVTDAAELLVVDKADTPTIERTDKAHEAITRTKQGLREGRGRRRQWEHRKITGAKPGEIVHHIDLNPSNNTEDNLHVFANRSLHTQAHRSLEKVAASLVHHGIVIFDKHLGYYRLAESFALSNE